MKKGLCCSTSFKVLLLRESYCFVGVFFVVFFFFFFFVAFFFFFFLFVCFFVVVFCFFVKSVNSFRVNFVFCVNMGPKKVVSKDDSALGTTTDSRFDEMSEKLFDAYIETENVRRRNAQLELHFKDFESFLKEKDIIYK